MRWKVLCHYHGRDTAAEMCLLRALIASPPARHRAALSRAFCERSPGCGPTVDSREMAARVAMLVITATAGSRGSATTRNPEPAAATAAAGHSRPDPSTWSACARTATPAPVERLRRGPSLPRLHPADRRPDALRPRLRLPPGHSSASPPPPGISHPELHRMVTKDPTTPRSARSSTTPACSCCPGRACPVSHLFKLIRGRLADDWQAQYRPVLIETFRNTPLSTRPPDGSPNHPGPGTPRHPQKPHPKKNIWLLPLRKDGNASSTGKTSPVKHKTSERLRMGFSRPPPLSPESRVFERRLCVEQSHAPRKPVDDLRE